MNDIAKAAVEKLKEAVEICNRYQRENKELVSKFQDLVGDIEKFRRAERELLLIPNMN
jgi:hypothetical protein